MKKRVLAFVLLLVAVLSFGACKYTGGFFGTTNDSVEYYGCPNSKRVKKLKLLKFKKA